MIRVAAIRFEPDTLMPDAMPVKADTLPAGTAMWADAMGVWIGESCIPWHRVHSWRRVPDKPPVQAQKGKRP
jgi:hypothetical protein